MDFYNEATGHDYQRNEGQRPKRGRDIERYIQRCVTVNLKPALFEMTANARVSDDNWQFEALDASGELGRLIFHSDAAFLSMIDGGTRLLGIHHGLTSNLVAPSCKFDVRVFIGLSIAEEIVKFLLINDTQKKVRTDLGLRVVQRLMDSASLTTTEMELLKSAVPDTESWKYDAARVASALNSDSSSKWHNRIQMPGGGSGSCTLQAFFTSLQSLLQDDYIGTQFTARADRNELVVDGQPVNEQEFLGRLIRNFWEAVALVDPDADDEPGTSLLWTPIGVNPHHMALSEILVTMLATNDYDFSVNRFQAMLGNSHTAFYEYWFTKSGKLKDNYPSEKGEATRMTGAANYKRVAEMLEKEWRSNLHSNPGNGPITA